MGGAATLGHVALRMLFDPQVARLQSVPCGRGSVGLHFAPLLLQGFDEPRGFLTSKGLLGRSDVAQHSSALVPVAVDLDHRTVQEVHHGLPLFVGPDLDIGQTGGLIQ